MSAANKEEIWRSIITGIVNVAPQDRLAVVSRLILSNEDAASVAGRLLESATAMIRINVPVSEWLPKMVRSKEINPMMSGTYLIKQSPAQGNCISKDQSQISRAMLRIVGHFNMT